MKLHHAYVGVLLMVWSTAAGSFEELTIGGYNPWLSIAGFALGSALLLHDLWNHTKGEKA